MQIKSIICIGIKINIKTKETRKQNNKNNINFIKPCITLFIAINPEEGINNSKIKGIHFEYCL